MASVVPGSFLFRYAFPVPRVDEMPRSGKRLLDLPAECVLPAVAGLEGAEGFGEVRVGWNGRGLGVSVLVRGKSRPVRGNAQLPTESDGLQVWIDTRNTQSIHRASRFCHQFCLLPTGGGSGGREPLAVQVPVARAREEAPLAEAGLLAMAYETLSDGYRLEAWLPAEALHGYDPEANPRLGFYYHLRDAERGDQFLSVGPEFPFAHDPSLWATLELL